MFGCVKCNLRGSSAASQELLTRVNPMPHLEPIQLQPSFELGADKSFENHQSWPMLITLSWRLNLKNFKNTNTGIP